MYIRIIKRSLSYRNLEYMRIYPDDVNSLGKIEFHTVVPLRQAEHRDLPTGNVVYMHLCRFRDVGMENTVFKVDLITAILNIPNS